MPPIIDIGGTEASLASSLFLTDYEGTTGVFESRPVIQRVTGLVASRPKWWEYLCNAVFGICCACFMVVMLERLFGTPSCQQPVAVRL